MKNIKKILILGFFLSLFGGSFAQNLNLGQFLTNYFEATTSKIPESYKYIDVHYTNIPQQSPLYSALQKAIYLDAFPNLAIELPYSQNISQDYAAKIIYKDLNILPPAEFNTPVTAERMEKTFTHLDKLSHLQPGYENIQELIMNDVNRILHNEYYNSENIDDDKLSYGAIKGMVDAANDPHTSFFPPEEADNFNDKMEGEYEGIGAYVEMPSPGKMYIISVFDESPAKQAGLQGGDRILEINGNEITQYTSISTAVGWIKGPIGTYVTIKIIRNQEEKEIKIQRKKIEITNIQSDFSNPQQCQIKIQTFDYKIYESFLSELLDSYEANCQSYIIDLRNNPGGSLEEVAQILDHFVPTGQNSVVVKTKNEKNLYIAEDAPGNKLTDKKIIILINKGSASASEIFAGTVKDYGKNVAIIGEKSYGKGTVQQVVNYQGGSMLKFTIAKRFTGKSEYNIDGNGINPDFIIEDNPETLIDEQMEAAKKRRSIH